jgi:hypothetical protein
VREAVEVAVAVAGENDVAGLLDEQLEDQLGADREAAEIRPSSRLRVLKLLKMAPSCSPSAPSRKSSLVKPASFDTNVTTTSPPVATRVCSTMGTA